MVSGENGLTSMKIDTRAASVFDETHFSLQPFLVKFSPLPLHCNHAPLPARLGARINHYYYIDIN